MRRNAVIIGLVVAAIVTALPLSPSPAHASGVSSRASVALQVADEKLAPSATGPGNDIPTSGRAPEWRLEGAPTPGKPHHVFSVYLEDGDTLAVNLYVATPGIEVRLFQPHVETVYGPDRPRFTVRAHNTGRAALLYRCPPGGAGMYYFDIVNTADAPGYYWGDWGHERYRSFVAISRLAGDDRYQTSYELSRASFYASDSAILVSGTAFPDALSASALAGALECPVLLAPPPDNRRAVDGLIEELHGLGAGRVYVVGGPAAVPTELVDEVVRRLGLAVDRVQGKDRYETAVAVARRVDQLSGHAPTRAFLVSGENFADGMSAGSYAYLTGAPVLLTRRSSLPGPVGHYLSDRPGTALDILGGDAAVSDVLEREVRRTHSGGCFRIAGSDRYKTAAALAAEMVDRRGVGSWERLSIASGSTFADALSGSPAAAVWGAPVLLTRATSLPEATGGMIRAKRASLHRIVVSGGPAAVSDSVVYDQMAKALWY